MDQFLKPASENAAITALEARVSELEAQLAAVTTERDKLLQAVAKSPLPPTAVTTPTTTAASPGGANAVTVAAAAVAAPANPAQLISTAPGATLAEMGADAAFLTPRGRFKLRFCEHAFVLVGKSSECVVPYASVSRLWLLPEASSTGGSLLIAGLSQPTANGKTSVNYVTVHSKPNDAALQAEINGTALSGRPALLLRDALTTMRPTDLKVTEPGDPNTGAFKPMSGAAVQCYNKATEASVYLLATELLVREGGRATVLPYAGMRAEVLPPSGRRTFDIQLECPPAAAVAGSAAAAGAPPPKPLKLELSLIPAEEHTGICAQLKKKKVNVNGSRDMAEEEDDGDGEGGAEGGGGGRSKSAGKAKQSAANAAEDDEDDEDEDDSDDEDDEDFDGGDDSSCEEEYDSADSDDSEANPEFKKPKGSGKKAKPQEEAAEESEGDEDEDESAEENEEEDDEDDDEEAAPVAKRVKTEEAENKGTQAAGV